MKGTLCETILTKMQAAIKQKLTVANWRKGQVAQFAPRLKMAQWSIYSRKLR